MLIPGLRKPHRPKGAERRREVNTPWTSCILFDLLSQLEILRGEADSRPASSGAEGRLSVLAWAGPLRAETRLCDWVSFSSSALYGPSSPELASYVTIRLPPHGAPATRGG